MKDEDLDFGVQVICTELSDVVEHHIFNEATSQFREVGHIGRVVSMFPISDAVMVAHAEYVDGQIREYLTAYYTREIEKFDPPSLVEETPLAKAIKLVQITRN